MAHLTRWLADEGLGAGDLTPEVAEEFAHGRRAEGREWLSSPRALKPLLEYMRASNVSPEPGPLVPNSPAEQLLEQFARHLTCERAIAASTALRYVKDTRPSLAEQAAC